MAGAMDLHIRRQVQVAAGPERCAWADVGGPAGARSGRPRPRSARRWSIPAQPRMNWRWSGSGWPAAHACVLHTIGCDSRSSCSCSSSKYGCALMPRIPRSSGRIGSAHVRAAPAASIPAPRRSGSGSARWRFVLRQPLLKCRSAWEPPTPCVRRRGQASASPTPGTPGVGSPLSAPPAGSTPCGFMIGMHQSARVPGPGRSAGGAAAASLPGPCSCALTAPSAMPR